MITIYGYPRSRSGRATWMMEELGQDYTFTLVDLHKGGGNAAEFLAINPAGKVPALQDDDVVITESGAIVTYLGDKFGNRELVPEPGTPLRGKYEQWCYFATTELEQPLWTMGKHKFAIPEEHRVKEIFPTAGWEFQKALDIFSRGLGDNPYILGDHFSAADILLTHTLFWGLMFEQPVNQDNLKAYLDRISTRPALQRMREREQKALDSAAADE